MPKPAFPALVAAFVLVTAGCGGSGSAVSPMPAPLAPLHDIYEASNVSLPDGSGTGSVVVTLSENGVAGTPLTGEIVWAGAGSIALAQLQSGSVSRNGAGATISALGLDAYTNAAFRLSGSVTPSALRYTVNGSTSEVATRVGSYVDASQKFSAPQGFPSAVTLSASNRACVGSTIELRIDGAAPDGHGLWLPEASIDVPVLPNPANGPLVGFYDGANVFALAMPADDTPIALYPSGAEFTLWLTAFPAAGQLGGANVTGVSGCPTSLSP